MLWCKSTPISSSCSIRLRSKITSLNIAKSSIVVGKEGGITQHVGL